MRKKEEEREPGIKKRKCEKKRERKERERRE